MKMDLITIYENYMALKKNYIEFIEHLVETDFVEDEKQVSEELEKAKVALEGLLRQSDELKKDEENEHNVKDLSYLLADTLFLAIDLLGLYEYKELGRFKMRVINYTNKQKHVEMFGGMNAGNCRVVE